MITPQQQVKAFLLKGGTITVAIVSSLFHTTECRKIVSRLRAGGLPISDRYVNKENGIRYKEYFIKSENLK